MVTHQWVWCAGETMLTECPENSLSQCHFGHHLFHKAWPGFEPGPPQWDTRNWSPEPWHDLKLAAAPSLNPGCFYTVTATNLKGVKFVPVRKITYFQSSAQ